MENRWTLRDARNKFSAVVEAARAGVPQHVTRRGVKTVVVLSAKQYERLAKLDPKPGKSFKEHLLDFPKLPDDMQNLFDRSEPLLLDMHEIDFSSETSASEDGASVRKDGGLGGWQAERASRG